MNNHRTNLVTEMVRSHAEKGERALMELRAASIAPALFKAAWTERAHADHEAAIAGLDLWSR